MGFDLNVDISVVTVFIQGLLSFFSPCVLPLLPVYFGYLSGGSAVVDADGQMHYNRKRVMLHTLFFVVGISVAFFLLGLGMTTVGQFFGSRQAVLVKIGGFLVLLFGLYQLGIFGSSGFLSREKRLSLNLDKMVMSPLTAFILGFTFSFAWTPYVGPALSSVLIMAASASSRAKGFVLIGVYTLGFVLPFLAAGLFTTTILDLFRKHRNVVRYTAKIGGVLLIFIGLLMLTGKMNLISGYFSALSGGTQPQTEAAGKIEKGETEAATEALGTTEVPAVTEAEAVSEAVSEDADVGSEELTEAEAVSEAVSEDADAESEELTEAETVSEAVSEDADAESEELTEAEAVSEALSEETDTENASENETESTLMPEIDFELTDQYGETHRLSDYKGKTVFLNFWATWCPPCRAEMPDIQRLYEKYQKDPDADVVILGLAAPNYGSETDQKGIQDFLDENGYTYPVLMDEGGSMFLSYYITAIPTTFMITKDGYVYGYVSGAMSLETMQSIIDQTVENS